MGWADKALRKHEVDKYVSELMRKPEFKEMRRKEREQDVLRAFCNFCFITLDFLELRHNYGENGMKKFCDFAASRMGYSEENEKYFIEMNDYYINTHNLDVLKRMGLAIQMDGEEDEKH